MYSPEYLYLGAWFTDSATMDTIMALQSRSNEAIMNNFSIFCASNTRMPFIYKKKKKQGLTQRGRVLCYTAQNLGSQVK